MSVDLSQYRQFTIPALDGGIDGYTARNLVDPSRCIDANNLYFDRPGKAVSRKDFAKYATTKFTTSSITDIYQYRNRDGQNRILCYDGSQVWVDDGNGAFSALMPVTTNDGHVRFIQVDDILIFGNDSSGLWMYHPDISSAYPFPRASSLIVYFDTPTISTASNYFDADKKYYYRITAEIGIEGRTLYETPPLFVLPVGSEGIQYVETVFDTSVYPGKGISLAVNGTDFGGLWNASIRRINIYRSDPKDPSTSDADHIREIDPSFRLLMSKDIPTGTIGTVTMDLDDGSVDMSSRATLDYDRMDLAPKPRYMAEFQSRLWMANVVHDESAGGSEVTAPSRVFVSKFTRLGYEPGTFTYSAYTDINREDNNEIMGLVPVSGSVLLVLKRSSVWGIFANGTSLPDSTDPAINVRMIDNTVGCIAPETVTMVEGSAMWMSQRGPVAYSGGKVVDIGHSVRDELLAASNKESTMRAHYDSTRREIKFIHNKSGLNDGDPASAEVFNLDRKTWGRQNLIFGIGAMTTGLDSNNDHVVYAGLVPALGGNSLIYNAYNCSVVKLDQSNIPIADNFPFLYQTPMLDFGSPFMDKKIVAVLFHAKLLQSATLHVIADNRLDTRQDAGGGFSVSPAQPSGTLVWDVGLWDSGKWGTNDEGDSMAMLDNRVWGKRFSFILSGTIKANTDVDLRSMTVFYKALKGVR